MTFRLQPISPTGCRLTLARGQCTSGRQETLSCASLLFLQARSHPWVELRRDESGDAPVGEGGGMDFIVEERGGRVVAGHGLDRGDGVDIAVRPWVKSADYWAVRSDLLERIKRALEQAGLSIPYPQRDLHVVSGDLEGLS